MQQFWETAPFWAPIVVIVIIVALGIPHFRRWRAESWLKRSAGPFPLETEEDPLDSSHIGFAPLGSTRKRPERRFRSSTSSRGRNEKPR
jgi:hypothetical protein